MAKTFNNKTKSIKGRVNSRNFCFTTFKEEKYEEFKELKDKNIKYMVYQKEKCPQSGKIHIQGYVEFKEKKTSLKNIKKIFKDDTLHIEVRKGNQKQARDYCMKADSQIAAPVEIGKFQVAGTRTDIKLLYDAVKEGLNPTQVMDKYPALYIKYHKAVEKMYFNTLSQKEGQYREVTVNVLHGKAGTGKTRTVYDKEGTENVYRLTKSNSNNIWFDGYEGQKVLLIDDFYGWISYGNLLELLDGYILRLERKGGFTYGLWDKVYITSNKAPQEWYKKGLTVALKRRIDNIVNIEPKKGFKIKQPIYHTVTLDELKDISLKRSKISEAIDAIEKKVAAKYQNDIVLPATQGEDYENNVEPYDSDEEVEEEEEKRKIVCNDAVDELEEYMTIANKVNREEEEKKVNREEEEKKVHTLTGLPKVMLKRSQL